MLLAWPVRIDIERQQLAEQQSTEGVMPRGSRNSAPVPVPGQQSCGPTEPDSSDAQISISARNCSPIRFANSTQLADIEYR
jgi:hypothetical protein